VPGGSTIAEAAVSFGDEVARKCVAARVDGCLVDLSRRLEGDATAVLVTQDDPDALEILRHSAAHVMAAAVGRAFDGVKFGIGPAIEKGFYYDFDIPGGITEKDLARIEEEIAAIISEKLPFERLEMSRTEAVELFRRLRQPYKEQLAREIPEGETISAYRLGEFVDLCRGPHVAAADRITAWKLEGIAGSYWRGIETNPALQRIYGTAFFDKESLDKHLRLLEEAKKRDHRLLGRQLNLFSFHPEGPGFTFWHPNGMTIYNTIVDYYRRKHFVRGYEEIKTPVILNEQLWHRSGHWDNYKENMYFTEIDGAGYAIKPMNCPGGLLLYKNRPHSYRELPLRVAELGLVHRHERSGVMHGLFRVRQFTQDDAHIFCAPDHLEDEIVDVIDLIFEIYADFGFKDYKVELSTKPDKHIGTDEMWEHATDALRRALQRRGVEHAVNPGEGAFYGPKIDFHVADCLVRTWQCGTIQVDFAMPERFELEYIGPDNTPHRPVMVHRACLGSLERFIGILIEHYAGALPVWLAPVQVAVLPVTNDQDDYALDIKARLVENMIRASADLRSEKIGAKIRDATQAKVPLMLVVGKREAADGTVSVRRRKAGDEGAMPLADFVALVRNQIDSKVEQS